MAGNINNINGKANGAEKNEGINEKTARKLGVDTLSLDQYMREDEEKIQGQKSQAEEELSQKRSEMEELQARMKELEAEDAKLQEEISQHDEKLEQIATMQHEKEVAASRGLIGMVGWYNNHPDEIDEVIRPQMEHDANYYREQHEKDGKSFYNVVREAYRIDELANRKDEIEDYIKHEKDIDKTIAETQDIISKADGTSDNERGTVRAYGIPEAELREAREEYENAVAKKALIEEYRSYFGNAGDAEAAKNDAVAEAQVENEILAKEGSKLQTLEGEELEKQVNNIINSVSEQLSQQLAEIDEIGNEGEEKAEKPEKERLLSKIFNKLKSKFSKSEKAEADEQGDGQGAKIIKYKEAAKRLAISSAAMLAVAMTLTGCANNLLPDFGNNDDKTKTESSTGNTGNINDDLQRLANLNGENAEMQKYTAKLNYMSDNGEVKDYEFNTYREVQQNAPDAFDAEVMAKDGVQTADNKETPGAFGPILDSSELEGKSNIAGYLAAKADGMAKDSLYMMYANSWNGAFNPEDGFGISAENATVEGINGAAQKFESMTKEEQQGILDKIMQDEAEALEGKTLQYAEVAPGTLYHTAMMAKEDDGSKQIVTTESSKDTAFRVLMRLNENGENEYNQGRTKFLILQGHSLISADISYDEAVESGVMDKYTVLGERNKCGGQMVIIENSKVKNQAEAIKLVDVPSTSIEVTPDTPSTPDTPDTPDEPDEPTPTPIPEPEPAPDPGPGPGPQPEPTPEPPLKGKTNTNPWERNNPSIMPVTKSFEQESAENGGARIVQRGQEVMPEVDTSGVNTSPAAQQDWAEQPTAPERDTGTGGTVDQSADSDAAAAEMLRQTEAALRGNS